MKYFFCLNIYLFFEFLPSLYYLKFASLNPLIDVGKDIYCQHNENNETIFPVKKSGKGGVVNIKGSPSRHRIKGRQG